MRPEDDPRFFHRIDCDGVVVTLSRRALGQAWRMSFRVGGKKRRRTCPTNDAEWAEWYARAVVRMLSGALAPAAESNGGGEIDEDLL